MVLVVFTTATPGYVNSSAFVGVKRRLQCAIVEAGLPLGTERIETQSPTAKLTLFPVSLQVVSVPEMVHVRLVAMPFFMRVNARLFSLPGATVRCMRKLETVPAALRGTLPRFSVEFQMSGPVATGGKY